MSCEKTASKAPQAKDANFPCRPLSPPPVPPKEWVVTKPSSKRLVVNIDGADDRVFISPRMQPQSLSPKRFPQIPPISEHTQLHFQHQDPDQSQQGSSPSQDVIKTVPTLPTTTAAATATATGAALLSVEQSTRTTKSFDGYRVKVIIPELSGTKMAIAQPTQTTDDFIKTILKYPYDSLVSDDLRLLIPMVPSPHNVRGFIMRPDTFMGTYGIGIPSKSSNSDNACNEIPVLILVNKSEEGVYDLSQHEEFLTSQSAGLQTELIPAPWCEVLTDMNAFTTSKRKKLRKLIMEGGIPAPIRGHVWAELAEATDLVRKNSGVFESIAKVAEEKSPPYTRKIRVDLCRSMPIHVFFSSPDSPGIKPLSRVLFAFGEYEHDIGYCQGLNFIAALLLSVMNEEYAFWTLVQLMRKGQMKNFFTMNVPLLISSLAVFNELLVRELPDLAKHFETTCVPVDAFAAPWFQTIFMGTDFPIEITMRVWDGFMVDGIPFIYKSALAFLKITREKILKADVSETMSILHFEKGIMDDIDPSYFIEVANRFKLKSDVNPVKAMDEVIEPESP